MFYPYISSLLEKVIPNFGVCTYLAQTGNPCPLCGGTRYIANIGQVFKDISYLASPFGIMLIIVLLEFVYRIYAIYYIKRKERFKKFVIIDIIIHSIIIIAFFTYEIVFIYNQYH